MRAWLLLLVACKPDTGVQVFNAPPDAAFVAPADGTHVPEGDNVLLRGVASDPDDALADLRGRFVRDGEEVCPFATPDSGSGEVQCLALFPPGEVSLTFEVKDSRDAADADGVTITVDADKAPEVAILSPATDSSWGTADTIAFTAQVSDDHDDPTALVAIWTSDVQGALDLDDAPDSTGNLASFAALDAGHHVITLAVEDTTGHVGEASVAIDVVPPNEGPDCAIVAPGDGGTSDPDEDVQFAGVVSDDGPLSALIVTWASDRESAPWATSTPDADGDVSTARDDLASGAHQVTLRVEDAGGLVCTDTIAWTVTDPPPPDNVPPVTTRPTLSPTTPTEADTLLCTPGSTTDADGTTTFTYSFAWKVDAAPVANTASTLSSAQFSHHDQVICTVTASDGIDPSAPVDSLPVTVRNTPPSVTIPAITPDPATTNSVLGATYTTSDVDGDTVSVSYVWRKNNAQIATTPTLNGATMFSEGDRISVTVTPTDGETPGTARTSADLIVSDSPPTAPGVTVTPDQPVVDQDDLSCAVTTPSTDPDGDSVVYTYRWTVDGVSYTPPSDPKVVPLDVPDPNELWTCSVTASDGTLSGPAGADAVREQFYGHVQWPCPVAYGSPSQANYAFYGVVYDPRSTANVGPNTTVTTAQVGLGPDNGDPIAGSGWTWYPAVYKGDIDAFASGDHRNDEYVGYATLPAFTGSYDVAYRFSGDNGAHWTYVDLGTSFGVDACDAYQGNSDGYSPLTAGDLRVQ